MPTSKETVPNLPLNGNELLQYTLTLFSSVLRDRAVLDVRDMQRAYGALENALYTDYHFHSQYTYANIEIEVGAKFHLMGDKFAFTLEPVFTMDKPMKPYFAPFVRRPVGVPAPPLDSWLPGEAHVIDCFTIATKVESPNLVRVHCGMPVRLTAKVPPPPGQMFPSIEIHEIKYDPTDYPPLPSPIVTDQTERCVQEWGISAYTGLAPTVVDPSQMTDALGQDTVMAPVVEEGNNAFARELAPDPIPSPPLHKFKKDRRGWRK
jgi:hypothetical protein